MLQRAWLANPQTLPFASHIKTHALVSLVQKGLQYHEIEQSLDQDGNPIPFTPSKSFFGPTPLDMESLKTRGETLKAQTELGTTTTTSVPSASKPAPEPTVTSNGHLVSETPQPTVTVKKGRKVHRLEPATNGDDSAMDLGTNGVVHERVSVPSSGLKSPSSTEIADAEGDIQMVDPAAEEKQEMPTDTLTAGRSVGVQYVPAKAADLGAHTVILDVEVARDDHVTRSAWRPYDSSILAAAGDSFCTLWKLAPGAAPSTEKIFDSKGDGSWVTALSWEPSGHKFAVATYNEHRSSIQMYDSSGSVVDLLPTASGMINGLHWAPKGTHMVVVSSKDKSSELSLWDDSIKPEEFPSYQTIDGLVHDITWAGDNHIFVSGEGSVWQCEIDPTLQVINRYQSRESNTEWTYIRGVQTGSGSVAVAAACSAGSLWIPTHEIVVEDAHRADITSIEVRPKHQDQDANTSTSFTFASASVDDTVKIWKVDLESKKMSCLHTLFLSPGLPALALAFSPDGYAVAAASTDRLFIWNPDRGDEPLATWSCPPCSTKEDLERPVNGENGSTVVETYRSLAWDTDGKKLAMGYDKKIAVVNLQGRGVNILE
ncbi:WD repeat protein [Talaromyces stipitatus ATCC 10500]|uniref:WD repeat protein n=1 Tax=Talaromyces stipitatus (strain ATCC 10500 / CBS 375.48 / QM 6759 / NRRL 1006) TaxID=441959 RepID=B8MAM4_TALSN|nr:WD repeat protein [Talaromyces stipitatus ATCC 10500]EED17448.1 WD repeat protein [Talaromyces stipitatus ATCC 10500]